jgi:hypothetical protein
MSDNKQISEPNNKDENNNSDEVSTLKKELEALKNKKRSGSTGWIIFGYILAVLGGPIGIAMGAHYAWWGKNYDDATRKNGYIMFTIGVIFFLIFNALNAA